MLFLRAEAAGVRKRGGGGAARPGRGGGGSPRRKFQDLRDSHRKEQPATFALLYCTKTGWPNPQKTFQIYLTQERRPRAEVSPCQNMLQRVSPSDC